jgi:photosystem II stability/assembly factor-like uncharacterized protein
MKAVNGALSILIAASLLHGQAMAAEATPLAATPAAQGLQWRMIGPFRGGRTRALAGIPGHAGSFLIGAVNGGVWKSDDYGRSWRPLFDAQPTQSIGAIAVAPSNPSIIYVGSGEGLHRPDLSVGNGVYRSDDAGQTWTHLGLEDAQQVPELAIDPHDPQRVYAAVLGHPFGASSERGVYRSVDGGAHWSRVLYRDADTGAYSVMIDPFDANVIYATLWQARSGPWEDNNQYDGAGGGFFRSTDGGEHWQQLGAGLPENLSQMQVSVAPSQRGRLFATVGTTTPSDYSSAAGLGVFRSDDGGEHWVRITSDPRPALLIGGGDLPIIRVDPHNADVVYSASIVTMKSTDGGVSWHSLRGAPGGDDYQNLWISPDDSNTIALVSDQGAIVTVNGGATWSSWFNQPTAQLYHLGVSNGFPYRVCSGQQESGSVCTSSRGNDGEITFRDWHPVGVIEYGYAVPDPLDANIVYGAGRNEVTRTDLATGQVQNISPIPLRGPEVRVDRTEPLFFAPQDPHKLYYAANRLYETQDGGGHWQAVSPDLAREQPEIPVSVGALRLKKAETQRGVIYAASPSPLSDGLIWLGTDDGLIWRRDAGASKWVNVTPPALTAWSKVTQLEASHFDPLVAYATVSRFRIDDLAPYIYRTGDGGRSWQLIVNGLAANEPVNTVREDPERRGLLYAGTEKSVAVSFDDGAHWQALQLNLPHTSMRDLAVHGQDLIVATHGRSFWILDDLSPLRQVDAALQQREAALLKPATALRVQRSTNTDTPIPPDEPAGHNPPDGAILDYFLAHDAKGLVAIEIYDAAGALVRRYASDEPAGFQPRDLEQELIPVYWLREPRALATTAGMHRWVWDLHYAAPRTPQRGYPISAVPGDTPRVPQGPSVAPGNYRVRLLVGTQHWDQPLEVQGDPRLKLSAADYASQLALAQQLAAGVDGSTAALLTARSLRAQIKERSTELKTPPRGSALARVATDLHAFDERLEKLLSGHEPEAGTPNATTTPAPAPPATAGAKPPGLEDLNGELATLYDQVLRADAAPTAAQSAAAGHSLADWQALQPQWQQMLATLAPGLNKSLRQAHLAVLRPELAPPKDPDLADNE